MKSKSKLLTLIGAIALLGCGSEDGPSGPGVNNGKVNPFKGKWAYIKYVAFENGGLDTVDYTDDWKNDFLVFRDSTGRRIVSVRPNDPKDSIHYRFTPDSLFITTYVDNFITYTGRPYVFRGTGKDTLDFTDPYHIEILIRSK